MAIRSTKLSTIIARMDRYPMILQNNDTPSKVRDIDEQIRVMKRLLPFPWALKKSSLRVFDGVFTYPVEADHDELAYLDVSENVWYAQKARFRYTSLVQFFEDSNNRNTLAEIWDGGQRKLGVNYKGIENGSLTLNNAETVSDWTASGVASTPTLDEVFFKEGSASIKFTVTGAGTATMKNVLSASVSDADYKKKYQFKWIYLAVVPTSISLRYHVSATTYLETTGITTQFDGTAFRADQWNLVAQDLNTAAATGVLATTPTFTYEEFDLVGASAGTFYVDASYARAWELMDFWYYSIYTILVTGATTATKEYFFDDDAFTDQYLLTDALLGDSEWIDVVQLGAMWNQAIAIKDKDFKEDVLGKLKDALSALYLKYPSLDPVSIDDRYNFIDDFLNPVQS